MALLSKMGKPEGDEPRAEMEEEELFPPEEGEESPEEPAGPDYEDALTQLGEEFPELKEKADDLLSQYQEMSEEPAEGEGDEFPEDESDEFEDEEELDFPE